MDLKKIVVYLLLMLLTTSRFNNKYPDVLRCGDSNHPGAMYFAHAITDTYAHYRQVYNGEDRLISFANGVFT